MKDVAIPAKFIRREIVVLAICLLLAWLLNGYAIYAHQTRWVELLTEWRLTLMWAVALYVLSALPRVCWAGLRRLFGRAGR